MKKITTIQIAIAFCGSFLGAGFVSGQELLQFFGVFGYFGIAGMLVAGAAFCFFGSKAALIAIRTGITDFDKVIVRQENMLLRNLFLQGTVFFLFGTIVVMVAGAGALLMQRYGIPAWIGNAILCSMLIAAAAAGTNGVLAAFNILVPFMVLSGVAVGVSSFFILDGTPISSQAVAGENFLIGNWLFAAVSFLSYNLMASTAIMLPLAKLGESERCVTRGIVLGTALLCIIAFSILFPVMRNLSLVQAAAMPMLTLAEKIHPLMGFFYAALLFCGMFGAALSCLFAVRTRVTAVGNITGMRLTMEIVILVYFGSLFGFKNLVTLFYPVCGYLGLFALWGIFQHSQYIKKNQMIEEKRIIGEQEK